MHWATELIGRPWELGARGPAAFDCWGLVRYVLLKHFRIETPELVTDVAAAARAGGWRPADGKLPRNADVLVMLDAMGEKHVGVVVVDFLQPATLLHAVEGVGVCSDPVRHLPVLGYSHITAWRLT